MTNDLLSDYSDGVLTLTLNRPHKKNAITNAMYLALRDQIERAEQDSRIKVVIITGAGETFTTGNDIKSFHGENNPTHHRVPAFYFMNALGTFTKPVIAAVNGNAIGIGATMLLHCDLVYATENAQLKLSFLQLGLVPGFASSLLLPRLVGHTKAFEFFTSDEPLSAQQALAINLISGIMPTESLAFDTEAIAATLAKRPATALQATKKLMKQNLWPEITKRLNEDSEVFTKLSHAPETQARFAEFLSKR